MCQKAVGNYFAAFAGVKRNEFAWTRGKPGAFRSSEVIERDFCRDCGTPLTYRSLDKDRVSVSVGSLDQPDRVHPDAQYGLEGRGRTLPGWLTARRTPALVRAAWLSSPRPATRHETTDGKSGLHSPGQIIDTAPRTDRGVPCSPLRALRHLVEQPARLTSTPAHCSRRKPSYNLGFAMQAPMARSAACWSDRVVADRLSGLPLGAVLIVANWPWTLSASCRPPHPDADGSLRRHAQRGSSRQMGASSRALASLLWRRCLSDSLVSR